VSVAAEAARLWSRPRLRLALAVLAFAALTAATVVVAHPRMFSGFQNYDDEGYMLTALRGFVHHGHLYDDVFTQYGPFYYEAWGGLFALFGIPVDHDAGRTAVGLVWVLTSLTIGLAAARITASLLLGLAVQMLVFGALAVFSNEPMHPGGIICLLLAAIVAISCCVREQRSPCAMAALGGAVAALALVKVNVGFFALAAVVLACAVSYPALSRRLLRPLIEAGFVAIPLALMLGKLDLPSVRQYALHVTVAALAAVIALRARRSEARENAELGWLLGGFLALAAVICLAIVATGTSPGGLLDGVLRQPLRQADAFAIPLQLASQFYAIDLLALAGAVAYWLLRRRGRDAFEGPWALAVPLLSIAIGLAMAPSVAGQTFPFAAGQPLGYPLSMLAFAWVALIAPAPGARPSVAFARLLLPLLAVLQSLHAYPVAGSQVHWSAFLLIPVGAICVADGVRGLHAAVGAGSGRRALVAATAVAAAALLAVVANSALRKPFDQDRASYDAGIPLGLPGAESIHLPAAEAQLYRQVAAAIRRRCPALVMLPGMDSFYIWTGEEPPSEFNATAWPTLFDDEHQRQVIADTRSIAGLCLLENTPLAEHWSEGPVPPGPLVSYLRHGFEPVASFGDYRLLRRRGAAGA
jgi:hypothetical protein